MALYVFAVIVLLGVLFLLYCFWGFSRELKPRKTRAFAHSSVPAWGSVRAMPLPRLRRNNAVFNSKSKSVDRLDHDYPRPARAS